MPRKSEEGASGKLPSAEEMRAAWQELIRICQENSSSRRLAGIFSGAKYDIEQKGGECVLTIKVESDGTKKWLEEKFVARMENKLKTMLDSEKVRFLVEVLPPQEFKPVIYLAGDKAKKLMEDNSEIRNLVKDLELDS